MLPLLTLSNVYANDKLFPTDILEQGEVDAQFSVDHFTISSNISLKGRPGIEHDSEGRRIRTILRRVPPRSGKSSLERDSEIFQVRYGLGSNWHIGVAVPYVSRSVANTDYNNPPAHYSNRRGEGGQNPNLWATYGLINDKEFRFSLNLELLIKPDTTGNEETSYAGRITTGWKNSDTLKFYGAFTATTFSDSTLANHYSVSVGAYKALSETLTLIPHSGYVRNESTNTMSATDQYNLGLSVNVRLTPNSCLIPDVAFYRYGESNSNDGVFHRDASNNGKAFRLSFYHLF